MNYNLEGLMDFPGTYNNSGPNYCLELPLYPQRHYLTTGPNGIPIYSDRLGLTRVGLVGRCLGFFGLSGYKVEGGLIMAGLAEVI